MDGIVQMAWDTFKGLGALAGLFASAHIFFKWATKGYPSTIIDAQPLISGSSQIEPVLKVINNSDRPILLSWDNGHLDRFRIAKDDSINGIVRSLVIGKSVVALPSSGARELILLRPQHYDDIDQENKIEAHLFWKFAQPVIWQRYRRLRVSISKQDLENLLSGYAINRD
jgi:hypothetical protein